MPEPLDIQAALAAVEEPELRRSIVELGMVQGVAVDGRTAVVAVAVPLPTLSELEVNGSKVS